MRLSALQQTFYDENGYLVLDGWQFKIFEYQLVTARAAISRFLIGRPSDLVGR